MDMAKITLKAARANADMSRSEAAKKIGVSVDTLFNWENGKTFPNVPQIEKIQEVYGVEYKDISFFV
ncbi:MAG: helix-turn-helix transcriptional regulator [Oscillospiraceae bacterium]|nr:helix-turn-helix transcriptional regulator [Oscillospiraceae bacterium]